MLSEQKQPFLEPTPEEICEKRLYQKMGMTTEEYEKVVQHLGRLPNWTETGIYSVMWSEHCSYKNSKALLRLLPTEGPQVLQGPGEGAGAIDIGDGQAVVFKIESHNHPSAVEPFQGAATGVGGIMRDVFSMGARPIALLNSLRFGSLDKEDVRHLLKQAVAGIGYYGNVIGVPTVGGEVVFDPVYNETPLVNAMCVGLLSHGDLQKGIAKGKGNRVIYIGASTGRDGIHGATFASEELSEDSEEMVPAVQAGDPFMGKRLMEACLELVQAQILVGIQDMGAAGLTSSSVEMAAKGESGILLNLDAVPQRDPEMTPYEMMLSESQERMLVIVEEKNVAEVHRICQKWEVQSVDIGEVTDDGTLTLIHKNKKVTSLPIKTLVNAPMVYREANEPAYYQSFATVDPVQELAGIEVEKAFYQVLSSPNVASKRWVYQQYDYMAQGATVVSPGSDAGVIAIEGTKKFLAVTTDGNGRYVYLDPKVGGAIAVAEAARNLVCTGAKPLAITDGLNFGSPEKPEIYWQMTGAIQGMQAACLTLETPVTGGNVSLYNETAGQAVYPTPIVGMVGLIDGPEKITTHSFKNEGDIILLLGNTLAELGGSELQQCITGQISGRPPQIDLEREKNVQKVVLEAIYSGWVQSAHDLSEGGLAVALAECCISGNRGAELAIKTDLSPLTFLFSESQSRVLLSVKVDHLEKVAQLAAAYQVPLTQLGRVGKSQVSVTVNGELLIDAPLCKLQQTWEGAIPWAMSSTSS